jgi:hypothetical protein
VLGLTRRLGQSRIDEIDVALLNGQLPIESLRTVRGLLPVRASRAVRASSAVRVS